MEYIQLTKSGNIPEYIETQNTHNKDDNEDELKESKVKRINEDEQKTEDKYYDQLYDL
jgi:hypothetical protein